MKVLKPAEIVAEIEEVSVKKAGLPTARACSLGVMAGAFIALAAVAATFGNAYVGKLAGACIFPAGLVLVVLGGAELFTGNNLMAIGLFSGKIGWRGLFKNWLLVFFGNFVGAGLVSLIVVLSGVMDGIGETVIATAAAKMEIPFFEALLRGVLCNFLVCMAVWMAFSAKTVGGKIAAIFFPVMMFVLCGFEHSVANMYYLPAGILMNEFSGMGVQGLEMTSFLLNNLLPVTIGNVIGGAILVGGAYYLVYGKEKLHKK